jgi:hypothetical protein
MAWLHVHLPQVGVAPTLALLLAATACSSVVSPDPDRLGTGTDATVGDVGTGGDGGGGPPDGAPSGDANAPDASPPDATPSCSPSDPRCTGIGNPESCGSAETRCRADQYCVDGACACRPGLTPVDGACVDLMTDPNNCGAVGMRCDGGVCSGGHCSERCGEGFRFCDGGCVGPNDVFNCGECGRRCDRDEVCVRGGCEQYDPLRCNSCPCDRCERQCCDYGGGVICLETETCP